MCRSRTVLTIAVERKADEHKQYMEEDETCQRVENLYGKFSRTFALPANIDESKIVVGYKMGVLHIQIPKSEESDSTDQTVVIKES